ncbi:MAG: hypothetical protein V2A77_04035 [Pseudomonadota bacterium]
MSFWTGIILKHSVVLAADSRRVYPEKGSYEDGRSNLLQVNQYTWLAAAGFFPLAGVMLQGFRQVFGEQKVDLPLLTDPETNFRGALQKAYRELKAENSASVDVLIGGISSEDQPYLAPVSSADGFMPRIFRDPLATICLNFPEPLQSQVRAGVASLKGRLAKEPLEESRLRATNAALRQIIAQVAAGSEWVAPEAEMVVISAKGSTLSQIRQPV